MTVGQLILMLQKYDANTPVVVRDTSKNSPFDDYVELEQSVVSEIKAKPLFNKVPAHARQVYDGAISNEKSIKLVSLSGKPILQRLK